MKQTKFNCPVEATLSLIGGKYKPLILWHLVGQPLHYMELQRKIPGATPKMLSQHLHELEGCGMVHREVIPEKPPKTVYSLTAFGETGTDIHQGSAGVLSHRDRGRLEVPGLDFKRNTICLTQQKTATPVSLPMLPEIKAALLDYLEHERASSDSEYVFLSLKPPFSHISVHLLGKLTSIAIRSAGIVPGGRKCGPHAFRASLASSMVNDDVPYEVVRNTLGHTDVNAIKSYAKLDVERLRVYALAVPKATGYFAKILSGGRENS